MYLARVTGRVVATVRYPGLEGVALQWIQPVDETGVPSGLHVRHPATGARVPVFVGDYVVATGQTHSIEDLVRQAFGEVGIDNWADYVRQDSKFLRPAEVDLPRGEPLGERVVQIADAHAMLHEWWRLWSESSARSRHRPRAGGRAAVRR